MKNQDPIETRLNAIIRLLSDFIISQDKITKNSIYKSLNQAGLGPTEIGNIFGMKHGDISSHISRTKKSKTKRKKNE